MRHSWIEQQDWAVQGELKITRAADTACQAGNKRNKAPEYQWSQSPVWQSLINKNNDDLKRLHIPKRKSTHINNSQRSFAVYFYTLESNPQRSYWHLQKFGGIKCLFSSHSLEVEAQERNVIVNSTWKTPTAESIIYFQSLLYRFYSQSTPERNIWLSSLQPLHCGSLQLCLLTVCGSGSAQWVSRELQTWCERKTRE